MTTCEATKKFPAHLTEDAIEALICESNPASDCITFERSDSSMVIEYGCATFSYSEVFGCNIPGVLISVTVVLDLEELERLSEPDGQESIKERIRRSKRFTDFSARLMGFSGVVGWGTWCHYRNQWNNSGETPEVLEMSDYRLFGAGHE